MVGCEERLKLSVTSYNTARGSHLETDVSFPAIIILPIHSGLQNVGVISELWPKKQGLVAHQSVIPSEGGRIRAPSLGRTASMRDAQVGRTGAPDARETAHQCF